MIVLATPEAFVWTTTVIFIRHVDLILSDRTLPDPEPLTLPLLTSGTRDRAFPDSKVVDTLTADVFMRQKLL